MLIICNHDAGLLTSSIFPLVYTSFVNHECVYQTSINYVTVHPSPQTPQTNLPHHTQILHHHPWPILRTPTHQKSRRPNQRNARLGQMERNTLQTLQLSNSRRKRGRGIPPPPPQGASRIPQNSNGDGLPRNAHQQMGREQFLEFRFTLPASVSSRERCT